MELTISVTSKHRVTLPVEMRECLGVGPGDEIVFALEGDHARLTARKRGSVAELFGSIPALPNETADLEREIDEAMQDEVNQISQELD